MRLGFYMTMALLVTTGITFCNFAVFFKLFQVNFKKTFLVAFLLVNALAFWGVSLAWTKAVPFAELISRVAFFWFIGQLILLPFFIVLTVTAFVTQASATGLKYLSLVVLLGAFGVSAYGVFYESRDVRVNRREIVIKRLPTGMDGLKIAQLTDLHLGIYFSLDDLRAVFAKTKAERPDLVVITGDLIDDVTQAPAMLEIIDSFTGDFPRGIYYVWGNHEYMRDYSFLDASFAKSKMRVLKNSSVRLLLGEQQLYISGLGYSFNRDPDGRNREYEEMLASALSNVPDDVAKILLVHHSIVIDNALAHNIDFTLTGHTHGTQVGLFGRPLYKDAFKYIRGMYENDGKYGYVSTGVSGWFPFRFGCPPEIAIFTLKK